MAKLSTLKSDLNRLPKSLGYAVDAHGHSDRAEPWRAWYKTVRWRRLRWAILVRDLFTCQMPECGRLIANASDLVADHIKPHRGNETLFWDETNLQTLCRWCHSGPKQAEERVTIYD